MSARLLAVNVVHELIRGPTRWTAIDKRPVSGAVAVTELGLAGDEQCDTRYHGGPDKALYAYAEEDADWWSAELDREIPPGLFGENLTTHGLDITGALVGERWRIGGPTTGILVEVRSPRDPCGNLSARMGIPKFHRRFVATGRVGAPTSRCSRPDRCGPATGSSLSTAPVRDGQSARSQPARR
ncbi:MOSC domain-containing protein [Kribbella sp. NPDC050241]|uniref:MOSC domain-containing protein n=1 Tax=Kribbella sp. NPDC050241 TaxID=3364115 RepID=UPI003789A391